MKHMGETGARAQRVLEALKFFSKLFHLRVLRVVLYFLKQGILEAKPSQEDDTVKK